jgi:kinesin family protein 20
VIITPQNVQANQNVCTEKHYTFTSVLNSGVKQIDIYDEIVRPIICDPFSSRGSTFTSYGVSNSGKTHTILGTVESPGIVPRAITQIFTEFESVIAPYPCVKIMNDNITIMNDANVEYEIEATLDYLRNMKRLNHKSSKALQTWSHDNIKGEHNFKVKDCTAEMIDRLYVWVSFVEIYNEKITDLLSYQKNSTLLRPLKVFSNNGNSYINGLTWLFVSSIDDVLEILSYGLNKVSYASTGVNDHSSRSHTIFTINLIAEYSMEYQFASFKFCDLAGAERTKKTGNIGDRLKEAGGINNSLLVLGRCLENVQHNQSKANKKCPDLVVPVRDSKLTLLLQSSLLGYEKFVMIVNLYPTLDCLEENLNVLKFGSIANQIVVRNNEVRRFSRHSSRFSYLPTSKINNSIQNFSIVNET